MQAIASKSCAHRLLICAAFSDKPTKLICPATNRDIEATANCLNAIGAQITRTDDGYLVVPVSSVSRQAVLDCGESGSTLRFMLPIAGALGVDATFQMAGRLPERPLSPLWEELQRMGCTLSRPTENSINCTGRLKAGAYYIDGGVSSQFITGLLFALALLPGESQLQVTGSVESKPYIEMTRQALKLFGADATDTRFNGRTPFRSPGTVFVESDWSNGAFFLGANALGNHITLEGLNSHSAQGDRAVVEWIERLREDITVSGKDIPDLIPILCVVAGCSKGATFENIGRLRLKESDRIDSVANMMKALGADVQTGPDWLRVSPSTYQGCVIDAKNDHRIAMSAAIASTVAQGPVTILGAECVNKSYPDFWSVFTQLGGYYEQYIR